MYQDFFGLSELPFSIAPDPRYLYLSEKHREALAHLLYSVGDQGGFVVLTGEVGTGKTTICRCLLQQVPAHVDIAFIVNPKQNPEQLLKTICKEFAIPYDAKQNAGELVDLLNDYLLLAHANGRNSILIIDEAQNLSPDVLEQLRLLTNLETNQKKLLQLVLLGQPELNKLLAQPSLRQLAQRVTARYHLHPLLPADVKAYIEHRLSVAGFHGTLFTDPVIKQIYRYTQGVPRLINVLCDRILLGLFATDQRSVNSKVVKMAAGEVFQKEKRPLLQGSFLQKLASPTLIAAAVVVSAVIVIAYLNGIAGDDSVEANDDLLAKAKSEQSKTQPLSVTDDRNSSAALTSVHSHNHNHNNVHEEATVATVPSVTESTVQQSRVSTSTMQIPGGSNENTAAYAASWLKELKPSSYAELLQRLYKIWGVDAKTQSTCVEMHDSGINCIQGVTTFAQILEFNRPAILRLTTPGNESIAVLMTAKDAENNIVIDNAGEPLLLSAARLKRYWDGHFTLLGEYPTRVLLPIQQGDQSHAISWLTKSLQNENGALDYQPDYAVSKHSTIDSDKGYSKFGFIMSHYLTVEVASTAQFDQALVAKVQGVQQSNGLKGNGIIDLETFSVITGSKAERRSLSGPMLVDAAAKKITALVRES